MNRFVGLRTLQLVDKAGNVTFPTLVMYPTAAPSETPLAFGPYTIDATRDAPVAPGRFSLVVISHGSGGSHLVYRTIAAYLAKAGFIVALPEHPGNNRNDNSLEGTVENLSYRPRHIRQVIDAVFSDSALCGHTQQDHTAVIGHSMGGYTALAVAGGAPRTEDGDPIEVSRDERVKGLVLLAPATPWYLAPGSLDDVTVPILMMAAEHDPFTPIAHTELVLDRIPDRAQVTYRVISNAGHFSFLSPFPAAMKSPHFPPSTDPEGFDRETFHRQLNRDILAFLRKVLPAG